jgi:hypothetical protein
LSLGHQRCHKLRIQVFFSNLRKTAQTSNDIRDIADHCGSAALDNSERKVKKSKNTSGDPITLPSKILAVIADDTSFDGEPTVYVAEAAGFVKRINLKVRKLQRILC